MAASLGVCVCVGCYSFPPYLSKVKDHMRACQKSNTLMTAFLYFPYLLYALTHFDCAQQKKLAISDLRKALKSFQLLDCSFLGGGRTVSEVGTLVYPYLSQHINEQRGLTVKLAQPKSGYWASSCDFVTNLQSSCWLYFSLILVVCKMGLIFLIVGLFKEHILQDLFLKGNFTILSTSLTVPKPLISHCKQCTQPIACHSLSCFINSMINGLTTWQVKGNREEGFSYKTVVFYSLLLPYVDKPLKGRQQSYPLHHHMSTANYSCSLKLLWKMWSQYFSKATWAFLSVWRMHLSPMANENEAISIWRVKSRD